MPALCSFVSKSYSMYVSVVEGSGADAPNGDVIPAMDPRSCLCLPTHVKFLFVKTIARVLYRRLIIIEVSDALYDFVSVQRNPQICKVATRPRRLVESNVLAVCGPMALVREHGHDRLISVSESHLAAGARCVSMTAPFLNSSSTKS